MLKYYKPVSASTGKRARAEEEEEARSPKRTAMGGAGAGESVPPLAELTAALRVVGSEEAAAHVHPSWTPLLLAESKKAYWRALGAFVTAARARASPPVYPLPADVFSALRYDLHAISVVVLGQDPYHGPGQGHGLAFSVRRGVPAPPSLASIFKELAADVGAPAKPAHGDLTAWAAQGVLLLNTCLTVEQGRANAHAGKGWETFTSAVLRAVDGAHPRGVAFLLWGKPAAETAGKAITKGRHAVFEAPHPSPLSAYRGFLGCKCFSAANEALKARGLQQIDWAVGAR